MIPIRILWDFDGTLFDTYPAILQAFKKFAGFVPFDDDKLLQMLKISTEYTCECLQIDYHDFHEFFHRLEREVPPSQKPPFPFVEEVLKQAESNVIVTHKSRHSVGDVLKFYDMEHYFTEIIAKEDGYPRKPHVSSYEYLHQKYKLDLAIGDRELDLIPAKELGIKTVSFHNAGIRADYYLNSYADFPIVYLSEVFSLAKKEQPDAIDVSFVKSFFSPVDKRVKHIEKVAEKCKFSIEAVLHDIGYAKSVVRSGFHPLDGALFAIEIGCSPEVVKGILFHSNAYGEAKLRGGKLKEMYEKLSSFVTEKEQEIIDFLSYMDITTSPNGEEVTIEERMDDIFSRYKKDSVVFTNMSQSIPYFKSLEGRFN